MSQSARTRIRTWGIVISIVFVAIVACERTTDFPLEKVILPAGVPPSASVAARLATARDLARAGKQVMEYHNYKEAKEFLEHSDRTFRSLSDATTSDKQDCLESLTSLALSMGDVDAAATTIEELESLLVAGSSIQATQKLAELFGSIADGYFAKEPTKARIYERRKKLLQGMTEDEIEKEETINDAIRKDLRAAEMRRSKIDQASEETSVVDEKSGPGDNESISQAVTRSMAREELAQKPDPGRWDGHRRMGYSEQQIAEIEGLQRAHLAQLAQFGTSAYSMRSENSSAADADDSLAVSVLALTNTTRDPVERENWMRREQMKRDANNQGRARRFDEKPDRIAPKTWFQENWDYWQSHFEFGLPLGMMLSQRETRDPLTLIPWEVFSDTNTMISAALNLKGLLVDREARLRKTLSSSDDPDVREWWQEVRLLEIAAVQARPATISLQSSQAEASNHLAAAEHVGRLTFGGRGASDVLARKDQTLVDKWRESIQRQSAVIDRLKAVRRRGLALTGAARPPVISVEEIASTIPANSSFVDFVRIAPDRGGTNLVHYEYCAAIINRMGVGWVRIGLAAEIDGLITNFFKQLEANARDNESPLQSLLGQIQSVVWSPVKKILPPDTRRVILCPEGNLASIPFAALIAEGRYLAETLDLITVPSPRLLLRVSPTIVTTRKIELFCDPDFGPEDGSSGGFGGLFGGCRSKLSPLLRVRIDRVPSTVTTGERIQELAQRSGDLAPAWHQGSGASENALSIVNCPWLLHLGTHGFYVPPQSRGAELPGFGDQPIYFEADVHSARHVLALAGARKSLAAIGANSLTPYGLDGLLTAAEASALRLDGTSLVTLAACQAGAGPAIGNEGLMGFRAALIFAGARHLVSSLWDLDQNYANEFLFKFYDQLFSGVTPIKALVETQRAELQRLRKINRPLSEIVRLAGPWTITIGGRIDQ